MHALEAGKQVQNLEDGKQVQGLKDGEREQDFKAGKQSSVVKMASRCRTLKMALSDLAIVLGSEESVVLGVGASRVRAWDCWDVPLAYDDPEGKRWGLASDKGYISPEESVRKGGLAGDVV